MSQEPKTTGIARALIALALVVGIGGWFFPNSMFLSNMIGNSAACADDTAAADGSNGSDGTNGTDGANGTDGTDGTNGTDGADGKNGSTGATGACGPTGSTGPAGSDGMSAYEVWAQTSEGTVEDFLATLVGPQGPMGSQGIKGDTGSAGPAGENGRDGVNGLGDYASFYDTTTQTNPVENGVNIMTLDTTAVSHGVTIVNGSKITFANPGVYNIAFSAQLDKTDSGQDNVSIWLAKNGTNEPWSATKVDANNNNAKVVAAWNFFVEVQASDYYQLKWSSADADLRLYAQAANSIPAIPSIILTVNQVG